VTIAVYAGCRDLATGPWWWPALDAVAAEHGISEVWHGACSLDFDDPTKLAGGDLLVDTWARARGLEVRMFPAPWRFYRAAGMKVEAAGMRRVADMLRGDRGYEIRGGKVVTTETVPGSPALVVCLPGGPGTQGTAKQGERLGLPVVRVPYQHKPGVPRVVNSHHYAMPGRAEAPGRAPRPSLPEPWVYIGRSPPLGPSPLANPYPVEQHGRKALELYKGWLRGKLKSADSAVFAALRAIPADASLVCHCVRPDGSGACHGRFVALAWEWLAKKDAEHAARRDLEQRLDRAEADALAGDRPVAAVGEIAC
jgi:hypothetical protein